MRGVLGDRAVDRERGGAQPLGEVARAGELGRLLEVDRLVVALVGLGRGREDRLRQLLGLAQAGRSSMPDTRPVAW